MISVFGSTGFIGSRFCQFYPKEVIKIPRVDYKPQSEEILYLISTTDNYNVFGDPHLDIDTNLNILINVLQNCNKDTVFTFVSSWFVYGDTDLPAREDSYCNPKGFYSVTKRAAEQLLISYCETFGIRYRIFRLANVIGKDDRGVSKKKNALQYLINELKANRDINLYYNGDFVRDYIDVDDVCKAIHFCMEHTDVNEIINIGSGIPYNFYNLMSYCRTMLGSTSNFIPTEPSDFHKIVQVKNMYLNVHKLASLGFIPENNIVDTLNKLL